MNPSGGSGILRVTTFEAGLESLLLACLPEDLLLELVFEGPEKLWLRCKAIPQIVSDVVSHDTGVELEEIEMRDCGVAQVRAEAANVDLA